MLYMIELHYTRENRNAALRYFWEHGSTNYEGNVTINQAWVATQDHVAYALVDTFDPEEIVKACEPLKSFGDVQYRHVTSFDEI